MVRCRTAFYAAIVACLFILGNDASPSGNSSTGSWQWAEFTAGLPVTILSLPGLAQASSPVQLWFNGVSLTEFIQAISPILGIYAVQIDPDVQGSVTIQPAVRVSREELRRRLDKILFENQAVLRKLGASYRISRQAMPGGTESGASKPPQREPVRVPGGVQASRLIHWVEPVYPDLALKARVVATSQLEVTINEQGEVALVRIIRSGHPLLQMAAVDAVKQWRYLPACIDSEVAPVITTVAITFNLPGSVTAADGEKTAPADVSTSARAPVRVTANLQATRLVYRVEPEYSETARKEHLAGTVWVDVTVDELGQVSQVKFLCGSPMVEQAVIDAVKQWRYVPPEINDTAVAVVTLVSIPFDLRDR